MVRHFLEIRDYSRAELQKLLAQSTELKKLYKEGGRDLCMAGKTMVMIFEKPSARTRMSFETLMTQLGGAAMYIRQEDIGGLAATVKKGPYRLDYGPHFFLSEKPELITKVTDLFDHELPAFKRSAQLYFHGRFYNYPLTARNVLLQMPISDAFLSAAGYFSRLMVDSVKTLFSKKTKRPNFEQWARSSFGDYLFKLFFKPYTEQFWQIPCSLLSPDSMPTNTRLSFFKTLRLLFVKEIVKSM